MRGKVITEIRTKYNMLSPTQRIIADFILNNWVKVPLLSIGDLAEQCNTSETTVMRFLRKMGFDSYQVFKVMVAQEISGGTTQAIYEEIKPDDNMKQVCSKVILSTINSINDLNNLIDNESLERSLDLMFKAKRIIFLGIGASAAIALDAFHKFSRLGLDVCTCNDSHMMSILSTHVNPEELVFAVSHSGESREILDCVELAKENGAGVISLTSYKNSTITKFSDEVIYSSTNETKYRSDAMVSRIIQLVIIDILYVTFVLKLGSDGIKKINKSRLSVAKKKM